MDANYDNRRTFRSRKGWFETVTDTANPVAPTRRVWVAVAGLLALAGLASWALANSGLFLPHPQLPEIFSYVGIVLDIAGLVVAIAALRLHATPAWIAVAAIVVCAAPPIIFIFGSAMLMTAYGLGN
jgi:hypothetical protein